MTITVHNFVMLGKTVPEERRSDGREFVCSAGYVDDLGLIRIYPLARAGAPHRWSRNTVSLQRNPRDSRSESWQLAGDRTPEQHPVINLREFVQTGEVKQSARGQLVPDKYFVDSIAQANRERRSLALIRPQDLDLTWTAVDSQAPVDMQQLELLELPPRTDGKPTRIPRLRFRDQEGQHCLQLREWGVYELIRKNGLTYASSHAASALRLGDSSSLLIGNLNAHRTTWLVIGVLNLGASQPALFGLESA